MALGILRIVVASIWPLNWFHWRRGHQRRSGAMWCTYTVQPMIWVNSRNGTTSSSKGIQMAPPSPDRTQPSAAAAAVARPSPTNRNALSRRMAPRRFSLAW